MGLADLKEATPDTTSEDIEAYAEQVVNEVRADRESESKSDAQIVNEHAGKPSSSSDTAPSGEEPGDVDADVGPEWVTDEVKAEATAYGIEDSDLADFTSREEFDRALRLFDKTALDAGRKAMAESGDEGQARNEKGQFVKKDDSSTEEPAEETSQGDRYEVSLDSDLYDEEIIGEFTRMRDHYESRLQALEDHFAQANVQAEEQRFDSYVDELGHPELFGKTGEETEAELERRRDLNVAVQAQMIGLEKLGRPAEMSKELIGRVANMTFGEQISKKQLKQRTSKISRQSSLRQGGSPVKPQPPRDDPREEAERLYRELEGK